MKEEGSNKSVDDLCLHPTHLPPLTHPMSHDMKGNVNQEGPKDNASNPNVLGAGLKSSKREEKASLSLTTMEPMVAFI